jgi:hypothetical protein|tara:strand:+ start:774 stop:1022 length:249 start_codon:yes stop_codon:yes gene_type:complete
MSLTFTLSAEKTVTTQPAVTESYTEVSITRIIDVPGIKKIQVVLNGDGNFINLPELSDTNYGSDWTYSDVQAAVVNYINGLS